MSGGKTQNPKSINLLVCVTVCDECVPDWKTGRRGRKRGKMKWKANYCTHQLKFFQRFPVSHQAANFDKCCVSHGPAPALSPMIFSHNADLNPRDRHVRFQVPQVKGQPMHHNSTEMST